MLFKSEQTMVQSLLENWPEHYYEISDIETRGTCLREILKRNPESADDRRRLQLYEGRFTKGKNGCADLYMRSWLDMQVIAGMSINKLNRSKRQKELRSALRVFGLEEGKTPDDLLLAEWHDFARTYIEACAGSRSYRTTVLGFVAMKDEAVAKKIIKDIMMILRQFPAKLELDRLCEPLYNVMICTYVEMIEDGEEYLKEAEGH